MYSYGRLINQAWIDGRLSSTGGHYESVINLTASDARGQFDLKEVPSSIAPKTFLVAAHAEGFARITLSNFLQTPRLQLEPWNTLTAKIVDEKGQPIANTRVSLSCEGAKPGEGNARLLKRYLVRNTDADGNVTFQQILPHCVAEIRTESMMVEDSGGTKITIGSGETKKLTLHWNRLPPEQQPIRAKARRVVGKVWFPGADESSFLETSVMFNPASGKEFYFAKCDKIGHFQMPSVAPGLYKLRVLKHLLVSEAMTLRLEPFEINVTEDPEQSDFDVGTLDLTTKANKAKQVKGP